MSIALFLVGDITFDITVIELMMYSISSNQCCLICFVARKAAYFCLFKLGSYCRGYFYTLSGRIGKVVASHAAVARSVPALRLHWFILCTRSSGGTAHEGGGCDQSIGSTVSDAIESSWLWLTATRSSPLSCFSTLLQVVDNWTHILW